ncbi:anti-sigma factor [Paenibacillus oenotherae]|uniref:Anti-sigma factor n=1 Tax=Paenibacillus oenotherae TaxID=1435645 RepID=A0ABS7D8B1_9BACL|nr:anti sigma factor C-terminal domain-containing protein [Paenibacillus oenotherae]MBW7475782.1 anti-sigma factor [Paenibacillus oenotherae]
MNNETKDFVFDEQQTRKLVRKAKLRSTMKIIGVSVIVTPIILLILLYGLRQLSLHNAQKTMDEIILFNEISAPNVHISNQTANYNLFGGEIQTHTYKMLGNRPYIWEPIEGNYNVFGTYSPHYGSYGAIQLDGSASLAESNQLETFNSYTGDREMFFYHPEIAYEWYKDSVSELGQLEEALLVELGLSFDQPYSLDEIESKLPPNVQIVWWWADTYTDDRLNYMRHGQDTVKANSPFIYGFHSKQSKPRQSQNDSFDEVDSFIKNIEHLRESKNFEWEANQVYQSLVGEDGTLDKGDIKIIGAVVAGTTEQLKSLQNQTYIKASTFGVISDRK